MLDPYTGDATELSLARVERILRQRFGLIMSIQDARKHMRFLSEKSLADK